MIWFRLLTFLFKYGPTIFAVVKEIMDLLAWIQAHSGGVKNLPDNASVMAFNDRKAIIRNLHLMAKRGKEESSHHELYGYLSQLRTTKDSIKSRMT